MILIIVKDHLLAMEQPHTRVVSLEAEDNISLRIKDKCISPHWNSWVLGLSGVRSIETSSIFIRPCNGLEVVAVQMEGVLSGVCNLIRNRTLLKQFELLTQVIYNDFDDLVVS